MVDKLDYYFVNFRIGEKFSWTVKPKRLPDYPYYKVVCIVSHIFILGEFKNLSNYRKCIHVNSNFEFLSKQLP